MRFGASITALTEGNGRGTVGKCTGPGFWRLLRLTGTRILRGPLQKPLQRPFRNPSGVRRLVATIHFSLFACPFRRFFLPEFGQDDLIPNWILAFAMDKNGPFLVHFGLKGPFRSANRTLAIPEWTEAQLLSTIARPRLFSKDLGGSAKRRTLASSGFPLPVSIKAKVGGSGMSHKSVVYANFPRRPSRRQAYPCENSTDWRRLLGWLLNPQNKY